MYKNIPVEKAKFSPILFVYSLLVFIIILKFGSPACLPEVCSFPMNYAEWLIFTWPAILFSTSTGLLLILTLIISYRKKFKDLNRTAIALLFSWILLLIFSSLGFINSSCIDFPYLQCFYVLGLISLAASFLILLSIYELSEITTHIFGAIFWATLIIVLYGLYQYFFGFNETRTLIQNNTLANNIKISGNFYTRLMQNYIFSTFSLTNTFAGYIILTLPCSVWFTYSHVKIKYLKSIYSIFIIIIFIFALILTGSRSAVLSLFITALIFGLILNYSRKIKLAIICILLFILFIGFYILKTKGAITPSVLVRLDYYHVAIKLFLKHIFSGSGWGSFFYDYGFLKSFNSPEAAHTPHNFVLYFLSQAGFLAGITILTTMFFPIILMINNIFKKKKFDLIFFISFGLTATFIHMLFDIDFQVPAIVSVFILQSFIGIVYINRQKEGSIKKIKPFIYLVSILIILITLFFSYKLISAKYSLQKLNNACFSISKFIEKTDLSKKTINTHNIQQLLISAAEKQPYSPIPWSIAGNYYLNKQNWNAAEKCFTESTKLSPQRASYYHSLFIAQIYQHKQSEAIKNLKKAYELFPNLYKKQYSNIMKILRKKQEQKYD